MIAITLEINTVLRRHVLGQARIQARVARVLRSRIARDGQHSRQCKLERVTCVHGRFSQL
jgi:hypothetical protein